MQSAVSIRERDAGASPRLDLSTAYPLSLARCLVAIVSYALLLTDTLRTGFATRNLQPYATVEPDTVIFGPYAYRGVHLNLKNASITATRPLWAYKYDSTSITMRSVVQALQVPTWPPCVLYRASCNETAGLSHATIFSMLDAVIQSVKDHGSSTAHRQRGRLMLRSEHQWSNRLNDYVFPWLFRRTVRRSSQVIHYSSRRLRDSTRPICGASLPRPLSCDALWARFTRQCKAANGLCQGINHVWNHAQKRLRFLQSVYSNASLELVVLEGADDFTRGGLVFHGRKNQDIVILTRARSCAGDGRCSTIAVEDYRYEGAFLTMNVADWAPIVTVLRVTGQVYVWLRVAALAVGVGATAMATRPRGSRFPLRAAARMFFLIPSQVIVYGSVVPILCYALAHMMDSNAVYQFVALRLSAPLGQLKFTLTDALQLGAVSMRSVWILALWCHALVAVNTRRSWSVTNGLVGIPEFFVTIAATSTVFAQVRTLAMRNCAVLQAHEVIGDARFHDLRGFEYDTMRGVANQILLGTSIDVQFLLMSLVLLAVLWAVTGSLATWMPSIFRMRLVLTSKTMVPYSAAVLWPTSALVVSWQGTIVTRSNATGSLDLRPRLLSSSFFRAAKAKMQAPVSRVSQRHLLAMHQRNARTHAIIALVNLAVMTDPITFYRLRGARDGPLVALFKIAGTNRSLRIPLALIATSSDIPLQLHDMKLLSVDASSDVQWLDLLSCG
ncbi:hypothetical protein PINS_up021307 [Pythium insidiosum]|nr:hypothetical protein PINS_up021307 [Pythium insidiosum]